MTLLEQYRDEYSLIVDSDCIELIKPVVDKLRALEKKLNVEPYIICGSIYNGEECTK